MCTGHLYAGSCVTGTLDNGAMVTGALVTGELLLLFSYNYIHSWCSTGQSHCVRMPGKTDVTPTNIHMYIPMDSSNFAEQVIFK